MGSQISYQKDKYALICMPSNGPVSDLEQHKKDMFVFFSRPHNIIYVLNVFKASQTWILLQQVL